MRWWIDRGTPLVSFLWREAFIGTFLERDLAWLGVGIAPPTVRRFWTILAHWHGQRWNGADFGRNFGVSDKTVRGYSMRSRARSWCASSSRGTRTSRRDR